MIFNSTGDAIIKAQPLQIIKGLQTPLVQQSPDSVGSSTSDAEHEDSHSDCSQV